MILIRLTKSHNPEIYMLPNQTLPADSINIDNTRYHYHMRCTPMFCYLFNSDSHIVGVEIHLSYDSPIRTIVERLSSENNKSHLDIGSFITIKFSNCFDNVISEESEPDIWFYFDAVSGDLIVALSTFSFVATDFDFGNIEVKKWEGYIKTH